jgi:hypothetical protein
MPSPPGRVPTRRRCSRPACTARKSRGPRTMHCTSTVRVHHGRWRPRRMRARWRLAHVGTSKRRARFFRDTPRRRCASISRDKWPIAWRERASSAARPLMDRLGCSREARRCVWSSSVSHSSTNQRRTDRRKPRRSAIKCCGCTRGWRCSHRTMRPRKDRWRRTPQQPPTSMGCCVWPSRSAPARRPRPRLKRLRGFVASRHSLRH